MHTDVLILGGGPAGLTAALEVLRTTRLRPVILEKSSRVAGMAQSVPLASGLIDVGGHRFHTRSERVLAFWHSIPHVEWRQRVRRSQLWFENTHYEYPLTLEWRALKNFGLRRSLECVRSLLFERPQRVESLADFFQQTYGKKLYELFFADYTRKVWGRSAEDMPASWGGERLKRPGVKKEPHGFLYPRGGPGEFWEAVAREITHLGGVILCGEAVEGLLCEDGRVRAVRTAGQLLGAHSVISTLPLAELVALLAPTKRYHLEHRGIISVNLAMPAGPLRFGAQWTYVNSSEHRLARVQNYRAWDEAMVGASDEVILGAEYFASVGDELWRMSDEALVALARQELVSLGVEIAAKSYAHKVVRVSRAYPCYWSDYSRLAELQSHVDEIENLFSCGRQGLHRYINMDQAMLSALRVVDHLQNPAVPKARLWEDFSALHLPE